MAKVKSKKTEKSSDVNETNEPQDKPEPEQSETAPSNPTPFSTTPITFVHLLENVYSHIVNISQAHLLQCIFNLRSKASDLRTFKTSLRASRDWSSSQIEEFYLGLICSSGELPRHIDVACVLELRMLHAALGLAKPAIVLPQPSRVAHLAIQSLCQHFFFYGDGFFNDGNITAILKEAIQASWRSAVFKATSAVPILESSPLMGNTAGKPIPSAPALIGNTASLPTFTQPAMTAGGSEPNIEEYAATLEQRANEEAAKAPNRLKKERALKQNTERNKSSADHKEDFKVVDLTEHLEDDADSSGGENYKEWDDEEEDEKEEEEDDDYEEEEENEEDFEEEEEDEEPGIEEQDGSKPVNVSRMRIDTDTIKGKTGF